jgi:uncharacterized protein YndB with AHSA1/START domain/uncharacterized protein YciI
VKRLPPIRRQVLVEAGPELAFEVFTAEIGTWWPVDGHSVYGTGSAVGFRDGQLVETGPGGGESIWGTVLTWDPPRGLVLTWHPGSDADKASEVEVSFWPVDDERTIVTVEHRGWERQPDPLAAREDYRQGWPRVASAYRAAVPASAGPADEPVWLAFMHTPGTVVEHPTAVFGHPDFREHVAFLRRLAERGVLVGAGPFPASGEGMTIVRLPSAAEVSAYVRLAHEDDQSVVRGLLDVYVRPWSVLFP